jgi:hypothetical protein
MTWLGYCFKDGPARNKNKASRHTSTLRKTATIPHNPYVSISVTIQLRLGLCVLLVIFFYRRTLRRRADDIFTTQRPIKLSVCSAQSGDKKCNVYNKVWNYEFTECAQSGDKKCNVCNAVLNYDCTECAQSGDKKCNVYNTVWNYDFTEI